MFGKISCFMSYMKIWDVYIVKRFPSNKLSLWGMGLSSAVLAWGLSRIVLSHRIRSLRKMRNKGKLTNPGCPITGGWSYNPKYVRSA